MLETEVAASVESVPPQNLFRPQTFKALHYRNFALRSSGVLLSNTVDWMQIIALSLFVLQLYAPRNVIGLVMSVNTLVIVFVCRLRYFH